MPRLSFPDVATVRLVERRGGATVPLRLAGVAFGVRTVGCRKADYDLGPFFSDAAGVVTLTRAALVASAQAELATGLMDYGAVGECGPDVELRHWPAARVAEAAEVRRTVWTQLLPGEAELYGSLDSLLERYRGAPNARLTAASPVRARWDGADRRPAYDYVVSLLVPPT